MPKFSTPPYAPLPPGEHVTPRDLAAFLQCSHQTVLTLIARGEIPASRLVKTFRIRRVEFDRWYQHKFGVLPAAEQPRGEGVSYPR